MANISIMERLVHIEPVCIKMSSDDDIKRFFDIAYMEGVNYFGARGYIDEACTAGTFLIYDYQLGVVPSDVPYDKELCEKGICSSDDYDIYTISDLEEELKKNPELKVQEV